MVSLLLFGTTKSTRYFALKTLKQKQLSLPWNKKHFVYLRCCFLFLRCVFRLIEVGVAKHTISCVNDFVLYIYTGQRALDRYAETHKQNIQWKHTTFRRVVCAGEKKSVTFFPVSCIHIEIWCSNICVSLQLVCLHIHNIFKWFCALFAEFACTFLANIQCSRFVAKCVHKKLYFWYWINNKM